ncbi:MAG TPA: hypothetical protein VGM42_12240 [Rhodopila sp.]
MSRFVAPLLLVAIAFTSTACVVEDPGPGPGHARWCYYHPNRCR